MSEQVMVLGKVNKGIDKTSSVQSYESAWLGRWSQLGNEVKFNGQSNSESNCSKELIRPEDNVKEVKSGDEGVEVLSFPMFKVSQKKDNTTKLQACPVSFEENVGSSSKAMTNRMSWMYEQDGKHLHFPIQEKTTQNLLQLIRPVKTYATVGSGKIDSGEINLTEEDDHQLLKGSTVSMKLKGKVFGGYLDLFPNLHQFQSLESSKDTEEDGSRKNESLAKTDTLEMDKLQTMHLSGSNSSSSTKGKGRKGDSSILRTEIPDMNEEPPLVLHQGETTNSATQSMSVDHFLFKECKRVRLELETERSSRWVKRLKPNISDSSRHDETKNLMKIEEASLGQEGNKNPFLEIVKSGINNGGEDITLIHPWIQRWCKKKVTMTDEAGGKEESFQSENQKNFEEKHYPSIAAMALMGKALTGLNPHGLRKTDSLMVWNSRDLR